MNRPLICSGVTGAGAGGKSASRDLCWRIGKGKYGKWSRKKGKSKKGRLKIENVRKNWKWKEEKKRWGPFFFFFLLSFFFLFTLKTTEIFYREKAFHAGGKKIWKNDFAPSEKYACYAPVNVDYIILLEVCFQLYRTVHVLICFSKIRFPNHSYTDSYYPSSNQAIFCNTSNRGDCFNPLPRFSEPNPYEIDFGINK